MSDLLKTIDFDEDSMPPSSVDLDAALRTGRRRETRNKALAATAVAAAVLIAATGVAMAVNRPPAPRPEKPPKKDWDCTVQTLPSQQRYLVDPTGEIVVSWSPGGPIRMQRGNGPAQEITGLPGADPSPQRVGAGGVLIGSTSLDADHDVGWRYENGQVTTLPAPAGALRVRPWSVNAAGDVTGWLQRSGTSDAQPVINDLLLWPASAPGTYRLLTLPGAGEASGTVLDDGVVVGGAVVPGSGFIGVVWRPDGTVERLERLHSNFNGAAGDWAFGNYEAANDLNGFRYNIRTQEFVDLGAFDPGFALAGGRLAGIVRQARGVFAPTVWHDGVTEALPLPPSVTDVEVVSAGNRTIYGRGRMENSTSLVWRC
ncbi:hypothetical protein [Dactylosporangium sp. NPDC005555]|uniref:hypothetical protein n=1 Tax=Dactylosporangium sp. NPDC005555 TaxID=3154889 RepID=UPI0033AAA5FB